MSGVVDVPAPGERRRRRLSPKPRRVFLEGFSAGWTVKHGAERGRVPEAAVL